MLSVGEYLSVANRFKKYYGNVIGAVADDYGMSKVEVDILLFLSNNPRCDTARDIAELRHIAKSYVSKSIDILIRKGYLSVKEDQKDRRVSHLMVLPAAAKIIKSGRAAQDKILSTIRVGITEEEERIMEQVMRKMARNIEAGLRYKD